MDPTVTMTAATVFTDRLLVNYIERHLCELLDVCSLERLNTGQVSPEVLREAVAFLRATSRLPLSRRAESVLQKTAAALAASIAPVCATTGRRPQHELLLAGCEGRVHA